ncbi:hypothetical protein [Actinocorallia aurantiaca]|uniref:Uncharacterized protein n=1 Tax=Actinocorallia aurantiaca TaxID=46204 RepID=A0ABP6GAV4_9ACTN
MNGFGKKEQAEFSKVRASPAVRGRQDRTTGPCELLKNLRAEPDLLVFLSDSETVSFRLSLPVGMGTKRGTEETGFICRP